jgi:hypothetical protein
VYVKKSQERTSHIRVMLPLALETRLRGSKHALLGRASLSMTGICSNVLTLHRRDSRAFNTYLLSSHMNLNALPVTALVLPCILELNQEYQTNLALLMHAPVLCCSVDDMRVWLDAHSRG